MCISLAAAALIGTVLGTGASIVQSDAAAGRQARAQQQAEKAASDQQAENARQLNKINAKTPDVSAITAQDIAANKSGGGGPMLTGPGGVDPSALTLSKNVLLGS